MKDADWRNIRNGQSLPSECGYCDQPCIVTAEDGSLVGVITTGTGDEGAAGEYVGIIRSTDGGETWTEPLPLEEKDSESSYGVLIGDKSGRLYCFYCFNIDGVKASDGISRRDMGGAFCFKYSDDFGRSWSARRIIPIREFAIDKKYPVFVRGKRYYLFWNVNAPFFVGDTLYIGLTKHHYGSFFGRDYPYRDVETTECVLLRCKDLAKNPDGEWETLPDGEEGIRPPAGGGSVAEEPCYVPLSDGTIFMISRSGDGYPVCAYSRDGGGTFSPSFYPVRKNGKRVKNCRAVTVVWRLGEGKYLLWFHNIFRPGYGHRNPVWCAPLTEADGADGKVLLFGEPEVLFYHPSEQISVNYPSFFMRKGRYYISETQKRIARIHEVPQSFIDGLFGEYPFFGSGEEFLPFGKVSVPVQTFAVLDSSSAEDWKRQMGGGTSFLLKIRDVKPNETFFDTFGAGGGFRMETDGRGFLRCFASGKKCNFFLEGSVNVADGKEHEIAWITDGGARVSFLIADGFFDDGGERFDAGWRYVPAQLDEIPAGEGTLSADAAYLTVFSCALTGVQAAGYFKNKGVCNHEKDVCDVTERGDAFVGM